MPSQSSTCSDCGRPLPSTSEGECLVCQLQMGLARHTAKPAPRSTETGAVPASFGDYEILSELGRGGMGVVYKARHRTLRRVVALKVLHSGAFASEASRARFQAEAEALARLSHADIAQIYESGYDAGQPFHAIEYIQGESLRNLVREELISAQRAATYVSVVARAIHAAHEQGVLHRDLKPSNILLDAEDRPHVTDFGISKTEGTDDDRADAGHAELHGSRAGEP